MLKILFSLLHYPLVQLDGYADNIHLHVMRKDYLVFDIQYFPRTKRRYVETRISGAHSTVEKIRMRTKCRIAVKIYQGIAEEAIQLDEYLNIAEKWACFIVMKIMYFRMKDFVKKNQVHKIIC